MPALITIFLCFGLQSLLSNSPVSAAPTFGSISFPNMLAVNASASASASASAQASANLTDELGGAAHPNATTSGTSIGSSGTLTMPGLSPSKTCVCQEVPGSLPSQGVPGTVSRDSTPPVTSGPDKSAPPPPPAHSSSPEPSTDSEPPTELKSTSPDAPSDNGSSYPTGGPSGAAVSPTGSGDSAPPGSGNASSPPTPDTPGAASGLAISDCVRAVPVLTTIVAGLALLYA